MRFDPKKEKKKISPFKITQKFKANIGKPFPIIFLLSFPIVWIRKTGKRCFLAPAKWLNALHISMSFNNRFSMGIWDRRPENICPFPGSQTQVLTVCGLWNLSTKTEGQTHLNPPWVQQPDTLMTPHPRACWKRHHVAYSRQYPSISVVSSGLPILPIVPEMWQGAPFCSFNLLSPPGLKFIGRRGLSLNCVVVSVVLCCQWAIINVSHHTLSPQWECKYFKLHASNQFPGSRNYGMFRQKWL